MMPGSLPAVQVNLLGQIFMRDIRPEDYIQKFSAAQARAAPFTPGRRNKETIPS